MRKARAVFLLHDFLEQAVDLEGLEFELLGLGRLEIEPVLLPLQIILHQFFAAVTACGRIDSPEQALFKLPGFPFRCWTNWPAADIGRRNTRFLGAPCGRDCSWRGATCPTCFRPALTSSPNLGCPSKSGSSFSFALLLS